MWPSDVIWELMSYSACIIHLANLVNLLGNQQGYHLVAMAGTSNMVPHQPGGEPTKIVANVITFEM